MLTHVPRRCQQKLQQNLSVLVRHITRGSCMCQNQPRHLLARSRGTSFFRKPVLRPFSYYACLNRHLQHNLRNRNRILPLETSFLAKRFYAATNVVSAREGRLNEYLNDLLEEYKDLQRRSESEDVLASQDLATEVNDSMRRLWPLASRMSEFNDRVRELDELQNMVKDMKGEDEEMQRICEQEIMTIEDHLGSLEGEILQQIVPPEPADHNDIVLEVTAGVGGQEAMLFASDIFNMYAGYAAYKGWRFDIVDLPTTELGGLRKASAAVSGDNVYKSLKYEFGVHRVQRVPKTEKSGRIHTSTATVAALPQPTEIDVTIDTKDLKVDTFRSSGPGGQHVNKTESAIRIKHIPTGVVVECQQDRSQIKNKSTAMAILRARIYQMHLEEQEAAQKRKRKIQAGTAARSEKIRTYNFQQDRITDHRLGHNVFNMTEFMTGTNGLDSVIQELQQGDWKARVLDIVESLEQDSKQEKKGR